MANLDYDIEVPEDDDFDIKTETKEVKEWDSFWGAYIVKQVQDDFDIQEVLMDIIEYKCYIYIIKSGKIVSKDYNITIRKLKNNKYKTSWNKRKEVRYGT